MDFNAHIYIDEQDAANAVAAINAGEGIPKEGCETTSYTTYFPYAGGYFIIADDVTRKYIEQEQEITIE